MGSGAIDSEDNINPRPNRNVARLQPRDFPHSKSTQGHEAEHEYHQQNPSEDQHGSVIGGTTNDTGILENASETVRMLEAHHRGQRGSAHGAESNLKESSHGRANLWSFPMVFLGEESGHAVSQSQPCNTHGEDQGTQEVADWF